MRRAGVVLLLIAVSVVAVGCASTGHTWEDEFTARLEGSAGSIADAREGVRTGTSDSGYPEIFLPLSRTLAFKAELIEKLDPPDGCQGVQEEGQGWLGGFAGTSAVIPRSMTPQLEKNLPRLLEEEIKALEAIAAEAETCGGK
jgi:hypothetical protein